MTTYPMPAPTLDDLRDSLRDKDREIESLLDDNQGLSQDLGEVRGELHDLNTRARKAGHFTADDAIHFLEQDRSEILDIIEAWHDDAHSDPRRFCTHEPCATLRREGWSLGVGR